MKKKGYWFAAIALAFVSLTVAGCTKKAEVAKNEPVEITMWVYSDWATGKGGELFRKWADEFVAANDDVSKITLVGKNDAELLTGLMSGVGLPDCFTASFRDGKSLVEAVDYLNLKPFFDAQNADYKNAFDKKALAACIEGDQMYAFPFVGYVPLIFRNLTVLRKAGINPDDGIPTWDDFVAQLQKIKAAGIDPVHSFAGHWFAPGTVLGSEESLTIGESGGKTTVKAEQLVPTMEMLLKMKPFTNNMMFGDEAAAEAFKTNKLGFILAGPWNAEGYDASGVEYDIVPPPAFKNGGHTGGLRGLDALYAVNTAKKDQVTRWLKYITDYDRLYEFVTKLGRPVLNEKVMSAPELQDNPVAKASALGLLGGIDQTDFFRTTVFWVSPIADVSTQLLAGQLTAQQAAEQMIAKVNALYAEAQ
ncbi:MAG: extracellular solute-binding protein [Spirochaetaceae bacterium]|jgi:multiple sugar transport system substrate-binding protein|nr:extracellular solute-binding protein [Spirochaetaceae bacterium]